MQYLRLGSALTAALLVTLAEAVPVTDSPDAGSTTSDVFPPPSSMELVFSLVCAIVKVTFKLTSEIIRSHGRCPAVSARVGSGLSRYYSDRHRTGRSRDGGIVPV